MSAKQLAGHLAPRYTAKQPAAVRQNNASTIIMKPTVIKTAPSNTSAYVKTDSTQVQNQSGAYVGKLSIWQQLNRFLVLGTSGNTYYASEKRLTQDMAKCVKAAIKTNGIATVDRIVEVSQEGAAPKNEPALLALAMCASLGDNSTKNHAMNVLPKVARTSTHLFDFLTFVQLFRGWGRVLKEGVANWYVSKDENSLAYQMTKYRQRNGWTHTDALRLGHPKATSESMNNLFKWATKGPEALSKGCDIPEQIIGYEKAKTASESQLVKLIQDYNLSWEMIPTEMLNRPAVFEALLQSMNLEATIRNLPRVTNLGLLSSSAIRNMILERITNEVTIKKARYHPLKALLAQRTYSRGAGLKGQLTWVPNGQVVAALENTFYLGFKAVEPTGKKILLGLDVSGSMGTGMVAGMQLIPREAVAAMAMVTARVEPHHTILGFASKLTDLKVSPKDTLSTVMTKISRTDFGYTDPSLLISFAKAEKDYEGLVVYTDNEVNAGGNVAADLKKYRSEAKVERVTLTVVGTTVSEFTLADPNDPGMLDVAGFDTAAPAVISDFIAGRF